MGHWVAWACPWTLWQELEVVVVVAVLRQVVVVVEEMDALVAAALLLAAHACEDMICKIKEIKIPRRRNSSIKIEK